MTISCCRRVGLIPLLLGGLAHADGLWGHRLWKDIKRCDYSPCFDLTLVLQLTGISAFLNSPNITEHYACVGFDDEATAQEGRRAADFFLDNYGVDLTGLPDEAYIDGTIQTTDANSGARLFSAVVDTEEQFRLIFAATRYNVDYPDQPVKAAFWCIRFTREYLSTGDFNGTIPAGSLGCYGSYIIELCKHNHYFCAPFLKSRYPYRPLFIRIWSLDFVMRRGPPPYTFISFNFGAELAGRLGSDRGLFYLRESPRPSDGLTVFDGHLVFRFPGLAPLENPFKFREDRFTCRKRH